MQRTENGLIIINCDFTGIDWDEQLPMIEGHRGSVLSLAALKQAIDAIGPIPTAFDCTMCLRHFEADQEGWQHADPKPPQANPEAIICVDCLQQADRTFARDADTDWTRQLKPSQRWR